MAKRGIMAIPLAKMAAQVVAVVEGAERIAGTLAREMLAMAPVIYVSLKEVRGGHERKGEFT